MNRADEVEEEVGKIIGKEYSGVSSEDLETELVTGNILENVTAVVATALCVLLVVLLFR
ncbi:MAG: hypothetical protein NC548_25280 [Lachnospiraceae bacterium]|nr:hypothetical protein [Lachnospiraceae bacterium]